jgi:hypothetical protein
MGDSIYEQRSEAPVLLDSIVGFIDLLGSKAAFADLENQQRRLDQLVRALRRAREVAALPAVDGFCATATFTDNIVVGYPLDQTGDPPRSDPELMWSVLVRVLGSMAGYQLELAKEGLFVRGGIAAGPLWIDDLFVFGDGLNVAYQLESGPARYPRVVLSEEIVGIARWLRPTLSDTSKEWIDNYLVLSWDGVVFLNYLFDESTRIEQDSNYLDVHRSAVIAGLFDNQTCPAVYEKYLWLQTYHNYFCRTFGQQEFLIDARSESYEFFPALDQ